MRGKRAFAVKPPPLSGAGERSHMREISEKQILRAFPSEICLYYRPFGFRSPVPEREGGQKSAKKYEELLFSALRDGDKERLASLSAEILKASAKNAKVQKTKSRSFFSRPARPRSGRLYSCPFRQSDAPFQCPPSLLTQKSYKNLTPTFIIRY